MTIIIRLLFLVVATGAAWCLTAGLEPGQASAAERKVLWQSREQFLALEPQDAEENEPPPPNDHPTVFSEQQLTTLLSAISFRSTHDASPEPLFTRNSLETIVPKMIQGLKEARSREDLTFAIVGLHEALHGLTKEPRVTTGRLFVKNGRLNLIVGLAQRDLNEREDRRLAPFSPGSRKAAVPGEWQLQTPPEPNGYTMVRRDWVTVPANWQPLSSADAPPAAPSNQPSAGPSQRNQPRSPAERLSNLNELKSMGLITDEEYRSKRMQILNEL